MKPVKETKAELALAWLLKELETDDKINQLEGELLDRAIREAGLARNERRIEAQFLLADDGAKREYVRKTMERLRKEAAAAIESQKKIADAVEEPGNIVSGGGHCIRENILPKSGARAGRGTRRIRGTNSLGG